MCGVIPCCGSPVPSNPDSSVTLAAGYSTCINPGNSRSGESGFPDGSSASPMQPFADRVQPE